MAPGGQKCRGALGLLLLELSARWRLPGMGGHGVRGDVLGGAGRDADPHVVQAGPTELRPVEGLSGLTAVQFILIVLIVLIVHPKCLPYGCESPLFPPGRPCAVHPQGWFVAFQLSGAAEPGDPTEGWRPGPPNGEDLRPLRNGAGHLEQRPGRLRLTCHGTAGDHQTREAMFPESERTQRGGLLQCLRLALLFVASPIPTGGTTADTGHRGEVQC
mmetsp:Transcript_68732/g.151375  ORF Transcript_68732/g.151375 Transcript_68732/m.151375 type:complete len:216 (+) Transcript_68732:393-1040(+)